MSVEDETLRAHVAAFEANAATILSRPRATVVPKGPRHELGAFEALSTIGHDPAALQIDRPLGEGGMGVVQLGTQVVLGRKVAIKTLRPEHQNEENVRNLLAEAWLAGSLEHPNVVPVHDLRLDATGNPQLVMKRIEGETWSELLRRGQSIDDAVRVLIQVCNAVNFANARGIVHRDLKPDNVMVGRFGEVYVVDWGIATNAGPTREFAGTLPYAAPEMVTLPSTLTARTDVYLLGAVLFEILTGEPPHLGHTIAAMIKSSLDSTPTLPEDGPQELCALARSCMQMNPAHRPKSALDVRQALERFLEHRGSMVLASEASRRLTELEQLLATPDPTLARMYDVYGQCRFGFSQALLAWHDNARAREGLQKAVRLMVHAALSHDDTQAAAVLLNDLDEPDPELETRVAIKQKRAAERLAQLHALERKHDPVSGRKARLVFALLLGAIWIVGPLVGSVSGLTRSRYETLTGLPVAFVLFAVLTVLRVRWQGWSDFNVKVARVVIVALVCQVVLSVAAFFTGVDGAQFTVFKFGYWAVTIAMGAAALEPWMLVSASAFAVGLVVARHSPESRYIINACTNTVFTLNAFWLWGPRKPPARPAPSTR